MKLFGKEEILFISFLFIFMFSFLLITVLLPHLAIPLSLLSASLQASMFNLFLQLVNHCKSVQVSNKIESPVK